MPFRSSLAVNSIAAPQKQIDFRFCSQTSIRLGLIFAQARLHLSVNKAKIIQNATH